MRKADFSTSRRVEGKKKALSAPEEDKHYVGGAKESCKKEIQRSVELDLRAANMETSKVKKTEGVIHSQG